jgi:protein SCO1/2
VKTDRRLAAGLVVLVTIGALAYAVGHAAGEIDALPKIGLAPDFTLMTQEGKRLALYDLRSKVVAFTFIYTRCADTCPVLTAKLAGLQSRLAPDFGPKVFFLSVTVDPERDTPATLRRYALAHGVDLNGWALLTGTPMQIRKVAREYGVYVRKTPRGDVDHTFLTSLVDQRGILRVQYLGTRFDPDELLGDIRALLREGSKP